MNYLTYILGLALAGALLTAAIYRGDAASWHGKYDSLQASYKTAAVAAETHAAAISAQQTADLKKQSDNALSQASSATSKANAVRAVYLKKLADLSKQSKLDLGHQCAITQIPSDLLPETPQ